MARYMLDALKRRRDVDVFVVAPFTNTYIPWLGGIHLPRKYVSIPDLALGANDEVVYPWVEKQLPWKPDLWIEGNAGLRAHGRPEGKFVVIGTDPHVLDYDARRAVADIFFCMQKPYAKPSDIWLPYAYDPIWHTPSPKPLFDRSLEITLIGLTYPNRLKLMEELRGRGHATHLSTGAAYDEARDIYHDSFCGLNWSSLLDTTARVFELMAFGCVPILNRVPDLLELFREDEHFLGFDNFSEAVAKIEGILGDLPRAEALVESAKAAVKPHTWDSRMEFVLQKAGVL
jgi:glycosyltransferase involved in cell wall biosynthesis